MLPVKFASVLAPKKTWSDTTCLNSMYKFYKAVLLVFDKVYPRELNSADTAWLLSINELRGFPRMLGSRLHAYGVKITAILPGKRNVGGMWKSSISKYEAPIT
jgi:hypothetical protein